jgi:NADH:ubiquinone oxidoreductase subunit F (NADH-binding)
VNEGDPRPTSTPPRPFERGVDGRSTLVQNVESLAYAALIARFGDGWYREAGRGETRGTALFTVSGAPQSGVVELEVGTTLAEVAAVAGAQATGGPVLLGGYFGGWVAGAEAWHAPLDPIDLRRSGRAFGCGVVSFLDARSCGVRVTAQILDFMAGSSAAQCGPCVFGLRAIADAAARLAYGPARDDDLRRLAGWSETLAGRGACRHPDGTVGLVRSALRVFDAEFARHQRSRRCTNDDHRSSAA